MTTPATTFEVQKNDVATGQFTDHELAEPGPGEVLVRVDRFALTANNITYGVAGDTIGYWRFFPAPSGDPWGVIPVWGFADVLASACDEVAVGERLYGYFPIGSHVMLLPAGVRPAGFADGVAHRADLPAIYNQYTRTAADAAYVADQEAEQMLYRPLFTTSFLLEDFLLDNEDFGASQVILTSASSKTSIGLAHLLSARSGKRPAVTGLTSSANADFVTGLGCYDRVHAYDDVDALAREPSVLVDMAGSGPVRASVHEALGDALQFSSAVGATHWRDATVGSGQSDLPGPKPSMFFAPSQAQKRMADWGREGFDARLASAWRGFLDVAGGWIEVESGSGQADVQRVYDAFVTGTADPSRGYVLSV